MVVKCLFLSSSEFQWVNPLEGTMIIVFWLNIMLKDITLECMLKDYDSFFLLYSYCST